MMALVVIAPMIHNQRRRGLAESSRVSILVVTRRVSAERSSLPIARASSMLDVIPLHIPLYSQHLYLLLILYTTLFLLKLHLQINQPFPILP